MDSTVGLAIQCVGILLITLLSFFMMRSIQSVSLRYWTTAWSCLSLSLFSLMAGFRNPALQNLFYSIYFLGEYAFGYLFIAGCRHHASGLKLTRRHLWALLPGLAVALGLPHLSNDFNNLFIVQAAMMAGLFGGAFYALHPALRRGQASPGLRIISIALLLLTLDFLHYVPIFVGVSSSLGIKVPDAYLKYTSIVDLILEILLGFGTVMILMEQVRQEVEAANLELTTARDRLELMARMDPLTSALNRHAFHSLLRHGHDKYQHDLSGCAVIVDIDNLKPINDYLGHAAGDEAIRTVAQAVRSVIRADDMLFRWGGDEFLLLLFGVAEAAARRRLSSLNALLARGDQQWLSAPARISVSCGLAGFTALAAIEQAIEEADQDMYRQKQEGKATRAWASTIDKWPPATLQPALSSENPGPRLP